MKAKTKIVVACIAAGAAVITAIIGIVPEILNNNNKAAVDEAFNMETESSIGIEDNEIKMGGEGDTINAIGNSGTINQTTNQPINNYYYYYYDPNSSDNHTEDGSEKETNRGSEFYTEIKVRVVDCDDKTWRSSINAKVGDIVEFQMQYRNISNELHRQVVVCDVLPQNLEYVEGSTILYNGNHPNGTKAVQDTIATDGVNIGDYAAGANAFTRFRAEVIEDNLAEGVNLLYNWGQVQAGSVEQVILQDDACVIVNHHKD